MPFANRPNSATLFKARLGGVARRAVLTSPFRHGQLVSIAGRHACSHCISTLAIRMGANYSYTQAVGSLGWVRIFFMKPRKKKIEKSSTKAQSKVL